MCGIGAAVSYGMNPLGALPMYAEGINTNSVLFYRYSLAALALMLFMIIRRKTFSVTWKEIGILAPLGVLFAISSLTLYGAFHYIGAGIACSLLFVYPVMVAIMMALFFKEKVSVVTAGSIIMALGGIWLLYNGNGAESLNTTGTLLVMGSALSYSIYIIVVNKSSLRMSSVKMTFYVLLFCLLTLFANTVISGENSSIQALDSIEMWTCAILLALFPTVISLLLMVESIHGIGSTPTAILGALEPLTAVVIGVTLFGEKLTPRLSLGILLILAAVIMIICSKSLTLNNITLVIGRLGQIITKHWRWK